MLHFVSLRGPTLIALCFAVCCDVLGIGPLARGDSPKPTPLNSTVVLYNQHYLESGFAALDRVAALGNRRVCLVPTLHVRLDDDRRIVGWGFLLDDTSELVSLDEHLHRQICEYWKALFVRANELELEITVLPHLDAGEEPFVWRNEFDFDPLTSAGGYSYEELVIRPLAAALAEAVPSSKTVHLSLAGEMGRSLFLYPESYRRMAERLRLRRDIPHVKIGISLNFSDVSGGARIARREHRHLQSLLDQSDFVGFSNYHQCSAAPSWRDFALGIDQFVSELRAAGLTLSVQKPIHFSEIGIGGGNPSSSPISVELAAREPWQGSGLPRWGNPWDQRSLRSLRQNYHRALLKFLSRPQETYHVTHAFLWSQGSWDPQGIDTGFFSDPDITRMIQQHNAAAHLR